MPLPRCRLPPRLACRPYRAARASGPRRVAKCGPGAARAQATPHHARARHGAPRGRGPSLLTRSVGPQSGVRPRLKKSHLSDLPMGPTCCPPHRAVPCCASASAAGAPCHQDLLPRVYKTPDRPTLITSRAPLCAASLGPCCPVQAPACRALRAAPAQPPCCAARPQPRAASRGHGATAARASAGAALRAPCPHASAPERGSRGKGKSAREN
jgi:hypothetical protein